MQAFAQLLDRLYFTSSKLSKIRILHDYFREVPDPDRGWAVAAIVGDLKFKQFKRGLIRELMSERVDPVLFDLCYDYVGETAETVSHLWPRSEPEVEGRLKSLPRLHELVETLGSLDSDSLRHYVVDLLDASNANERWAFIKLATGGLRIGVSERFLKQTLADYGDIDINEIEALWHSLKPPYESLFAWLEKKGARPEVAPGPTFHPVMLAHPIADERLSEINPQDFVAEWKYDGVRVQAVVTAHGSALYSRTGEDISNTFPDLMGALRSPVVLDAELVVQPNRQWGTFNDLQQRLNRKHVTPRMLGELPAHLIVYDILQEGDESLIQLSWEVRRQRLEEWHAQHGNTFVSLSPIVDFQSVDALKPQRAECGTTGKAHLEGFMFKRRDSLYVPGRPMGQWYKWKRDPFLIDAVMMYAQRGHGKRSSFYSDYTFGLWKGDVLSPVGKAYFGFTDEELKQLDQWVRDHTISRFGPVREVEQGLVLEIAFDSVHESPRHKSGVALRFPRIHRIRWDKPAAEADQLETIKAFIIQQSKPSQLEFFEDMELW